MIQSELLGRAKDALLKRAERDAWAAFGFAGPPEEPPQSLTEEVLIRAQMLLSAPIADRLDEEFGARLVIFHPDSALEFDMRYWLWRRAERGHATRATRCVGLDRLYAMDVPAANLWGYELTGWVGWCFWLDGDHD